MLAYWQFHYGVVGHRIRICLLVTQSFTRLLLWNSFAVDHIHMHTNTLRISQHICAIRSHCMSMGLSLVCACSCCFHCVFPSAPFDIAHIPVLLFAFFGIHWNKYFRHWLPLVFCVHQYICTCIHYSFMRLRMCKCACACASTFKYFRCKNICLLLPLLLPLRAGGVNAYECTYSSA